MASEQARDAEPARDVDPLGGQCRYVIAGGEVVGHAELLDLELADLELADRGPTDREAPDAEPPDREAADRGGADGERADRHGAARLDAGRRRSAEPRAGRRRSRVASASRNRSAASLRRMSARPPDPAGIQHVPWETPHRILDACGGLEVQTVEPLAGDPLPDHDEVAGRRRDGRPDERRRSRALPGAGGRSASGSPRRRGARCRCSASASAPSCWPARSEPR